MVPPVPYAELTPLCYYSIFSCLHINAILELSYPESHWMLMFSWLFDMTTKGHIFTDIFKAAAQAPCNPQGT